MGLRKAFQVIFASAAWCLLCAAAVFAQSAPQPKCLQPGRLEKIREQIKAAQPQSENIALKDELIKAARDFSAAIHLANVEKRGDEKAKADREKLGTDLTARVCSILNTQGWPARTAIAPEGMNALVFVVSKALPFPMQIELYPAIADAFEKGEIAGGEMLAAYVDQLRVVIGRKQLYGTQAYIRDGFLVLAPVESPETVDERRRKFGMQPLRDYERLLEISNQMPLIRSVGDAPRETASATPGASTSGEGTTVAASALSPAESEQAITVDTAFVNLDVVVGTNSAEPVALEKSDFRLADNGKPADIESFAKADAPFDIVLLLDLSGSTSDKVGLIKRTTRRFVEMKRPVDRVAVIAFHDSQTVVSELEADKQVLLERIKDIKGYGASYVWDAVKTGIDMLERKSGKDRRKAIVLMSDGVDTSLSFTSRLGSRTSFADLTERIQRSTVSIFPIYLDTEGPDPYSKKVYAIARHTLKFIADQSAGTLYTARKIEDLAGIYDQVLKDVGTVYTLGFSPDVEPGDPRWRTLRVDIPTRPGLKIKHRPGYFVR
jgi:VWFA-related protein